MRWPRTRFLRLWITNLAWGLALALVQGAGNEDSAPKHRSWWAYQPVVDRAVPILPDRPSTVANEIDAFIEAKLRQRGIPPSPLADARTLLRRVTFDLTGLPPSPEEIQAFLNDTSPGAFDRVVDRLLASPRYGERWARHWMDVVRYADYYDSNPKTRTGSCELTEAWRYRDWLVDVLNRDLPYNQFIVHQLAGDLLPSPDGKDFYEQGLVATTFLSNGVWDRGDADKEKIVSDMVDDQIDTLGKAFLGLTLGCARCHDHKFDPISQEDYYALAGIFYSAHMLKDLGAKGAEYVVNRVPLAPKPVVEKRAEQLRRLADLKAILAKFPTNAGETNTEIQQLLQRQTLLQRELIPEPPLAMAMQEGGTPGGLFPAIQDVPLHIRGSYARPGPIVPRRLPTFFARPDQPVRFTGSGRRELAEWIASTNNPLVARVLVNRVWHYHFGEGFVRTPGNLGLLSEPPSHPELLDWLATRFTAEGWSLKRLHRRIVTSNAYQRSAHAEPNSLERDPDNRWLGRFTPRRLEAEAIRDSLLFVAGDLELAGGGPARDDLHAQCRSLYVQTARWDRSSFATLFDAANPDASVDKRVASTVAPQSLFLLNHAFSQNRARRLAQRLLQSQDTTPAGRIQNAFERLYSRPATEREVHLLNGLLESNGGAESPTAWESVSLVLLCGNEFVYIE